MAKFPLDWMKFYPQETLADGRFQSWTMDERGAWFTLVLACWADGSIPEGVTALARFLHMDTGDVTRIWSAIGDRFVPHPSEPGRLVSPRLEDEREKALALAAKRGEAGERGATARWNKPKRAHGKRMPVPSQPDGKANAVAMANDGGVGKGSGSPPQRARLVSPFPAGQDPHPLTTAVLAALYERGLDAAPPGAGSAGRVEAAIATATLPVAVERLAAVYADPNAKRPLTFHVEAIRGEKRRPSTRGDLGADLDRWQDHLAPDEKRQVRAELVALHPDLADAPIGITGDPSVHPVAAIAEVYAKWRAVVEARA
jgi:hypothetical protein